MVSEDLLVRDLALGRMVMEGLEVVDMVVEVAEEVEVLVVEEATLVAAVYLVVNGEEVKDCQRVDLEGTVIAAEVEGERHINGDCNTILFYEGQKLMHAPRS